MRVVIPYVSGHLKDGVFAAASASGYAVELHDVSASDTEFWRLLDSLWRRGESFLCIEHDIVVGRDTVKSFAECENPWCSAHYPYNGGVSTGLGCTRFRQSLMREHPDVMSVVGEMEDAVHSPRHWCALDANLRTLLGILGVPHCGNHGQVEHLGDQLPSHAVCRPRNSGEQRNGEQG